MGMQNRQRRADRRRRARRSTHDDARQNRHGDSRGRWGAWRSERSRPPLSLDDAVTAAVYAVRARPVDLPRMVEQLAERAADDGDDGDSDGGDGLAGVLTGRLIRAVGECWSRGWQPADLAHVIGRRLRPAHRRVCAAAIALDARSYRYTAAADPTWLAQVDAVAPPESAEELETRTYDAVLVAVETLAGLYDLPTQPRLCAPPSEWGRGPRWETGGAAPRPRAPGAAASDPKMTERVRALLAKAESTEFPDEAEAFTAKAQELIARHAIDVAMLQGGPSEGPHAAGRRVLLDDPYAKAKGLLLASIASANHCRTVRDQQFGICTIFGAPHDLDAVELLYTSLLAQATAAMVTAGRAGGRARSRGFRSTFLVAYASRIGERLREATSSAVSQARVDHGDDVLPVLASRSEAADAARDEAFPHLRRERVSARDPAGWIAGRAAADHANLGPTTALRPGRDDAVTPK